MKKYKSFYYAVKDRYPAVIADLGEWMHRCAFDEARYDTIGDNPRVFSKAKSETILAAKKRRNEEAI